jgi:S1-C subfamily serine protease
VPPSAAGAVQIKPTKPTENTQAAETIQKVAPSIVSIEVQITKREASSSEHPVAKERDSTKGIKSKPAKGSSTGEHALDDFFKEFFKDQPQAPLTTTLVQWSGFTISGDGFVVTSYEDALNSGARISITLANGLKYTAKLIGAHAPSHLALLKIDSAETFPYIGLGKRNATIGERLLDLGNPFGFAASARTFTVSGYQKVDGFLESISLDPPFQRGETGAPLFDLSGTVVGVAYRAERASPNGYAVPVNVVAEVVDQIKRNGAVVDQVALNKESSRTQALVSTAATMFSLEVPKHALSTTQGTVGLVEVEGERGSKVNGSGFLISADGYVVTANSIIDNALKIEINFDKNKKFAAELVGTDPLSDIALLKIKTSQHFPFVKFADKLPRVGDWIFTVGLGRSMSAGVVSAQGRDIGSEPHDYMQVDAAVNRGDGGGPTFNLDGDVIGVISAMYSPSGANVGINFAVPAKTASEVVAQLKSRGYMNRGWLGVKSLDIDKDTAESLGLNESKGALVTDVTRPGPAAEAGLTNGDAILAVDGSKVAGTRDLERQIAEHAPGTKVELDILRVGKEQNISVKLGRPSSSRCSAAKEEACITTSTG